MIPPLYKSNPKAASSKANRIQLSFPFELPRKLTRRRRAKEKLKLYAKYMGISEALKPQIRRPRLSRKEAIKAFTPFEHAVLSDLFKIPRLRIARDIDIRAAVDRKGNPLLDLEVKYYLYPDLPLRNAAAQILLKSAENQLPNYYSFRTKERVRKPGIGATGKPITLKPQHILTIFWPSGMGSDCVEAYYVTYVPGYDRFVVTVSQDSPDRYGCEDFVLGWFSSRRDLRLSAGRVLSRFWRHLYNTCGQERWEECWATGIMISDYAEHLANRLWGELYYRIRRPSPKPRDPYPSLFSKESI
jgi:hypothetical protein